MGAMSFCWSLEGRNLARLLPEAGPPGVALTFVSGGLQVALLRAGSHHHAAVYAREY